MEEIDDSISISVSSGQLKMYQPLIQPKDIAKTSIKEVCKDLEI